MIELGTGVLAVRVGSGLARSCAVTDDGRLKCWGNNTSGALGIGEPADQHRGDHPDEMGDDLPYVDLGDCSTAPDFTPCGFEAAEGEPDYDYKICVNGVCVMPGCGTTACNTPGPRWRPPDTGQADCYDDLDVLTGCPYYDPDLKLCGEGDDYVPFCGQDAHYHLDEQTDRWVVTEPSIEVNPGVFEVHRYVEDTATGLFWQGCSAGMSGAGCGVGGNVVPEWGDALVHCDQLGWAGHDDWRLPDFYELLSLARYSTVSAIDTTVFPPLNANAYWTSTNDHQRSDMALAILPNSGEARVIAKGNLKPVRCVRGAPAVHQDRYAVIGQAQRVVVDRHTSLTWTGCPLNELGASCDAPFKTGSWQEMLAFCETLVWATWHDWRLPSYTELASILDPGNRRLLLEHVGGTWPGTIEVTSSSTCVSDESRAYGMMGEDRFPCRDKTPGEAPPFWPICVRNTN